MEIGANVFSAYEPRGGRSFIPPDTGEFLGSELSRAAVTRRHRYDGYMVTGGGK